MQSARTRSRLRKQQKERGNADDFLLHVEWVASCHVHPELCLVLDATRSRIHVRTLKMSHKPLRQGDTVRHRSANVARNPRLATSLQISQIVSYSVRLAKGGWRQLHDCCACVKTVKWPWQTVFPGERILMEELKRASVDVAILA